MKKTRTTGQTCVGDLRLTPLDVGFDLRLQDMPVRIPENFESVGIEEGGETYLVEGTRDEMIEAIKAAGYHIWREEKE
jgi:hypothetical protein